MIPKTEDITKFDESSVPVLKKILDGMALATERTIYQTTVPVKEDMELGTKVIVDDGVSIKRIYWLTGKDRLGYVNLT
jgi:hypothetical protein